jgi:hypothetical protein
MITHKFNDSIFKDLNEYWWDPTFSWRNKYRGLSPYLGPKFIGSTTIFVFVTDAWHLFKSIKLNSLFFGVAFISMEMLGEFNWGIICLTVAARVVYGVVFTVLYDKILKSY